MAAGYGVPVEKGILLVETYPASPEAAEEYHRWYDEVHLPEILQVDGIVSARRLESLDGGPFLAIYEVEGDVEAARTRLQETAGTRAKPVGVSQDPPPLVRWFRTR